MRNRKGDKERLTKKLDDLFLQLERYGFDTAGCDGRVKYVSIFKHSDCYSISSNSSDNLVLEIKEDLQNE